MESTPEVQHDAEVDAIRIVFDAMKDLEPESQVRVLDYIATRLKIRVAKSNEVNPGERSRTSQNDEGRRVLAEASDTELDDEIAEGQEQDDDDAGSQGDGDPNGDSLEGINAVAQKWMRRNSLSAEQLSHLFSLGVDDIDLVAPKVPGDSLRQRFKSVLLLQGVASLLSSGAARVDHKKLKEAANHYNADVGTNFAKAMHAVAALVKGNAAAGYTLTTRGLNEAVDIIKKMTPTKKE